MDFPDNAEASSRYDRVLTAESLAPKTTYARILGLADNVATILDVSGNTGYFGHFFIERGAAVARIENDPGR